MEASSLSVDAKRFVVITGREVNADLAGLIATSRRDGTLEGAGEDNERIEMASTIISELTESGLGDEVGLLDDGNHHPITTAMGPAAAVVVSSRDITGMVDLITRSPRRRNYAQSGRSSSTMTPGVAVGPAAVVVPRADRDIARMAHVTTRILRTQNYSKWWKLFYHDAGVSSYACASAW